MLGFGGFSGPVAEQRVPLDSRHVWPGIPGCWLTGEWRAFEVRTLSARGQSVAVFGPCALGRADLAELATRGAPDDVAWRWSGSYTVVHRDASGTTVWTDLGGAWPIYTTTADEGVYWSSSARTLAALDRKGVDQDRLAAWLLAPGVPALLARRSAFAGVDAVPAGHRLFLPTFGQPATRRVWRPTPRHGAHAGRLRAELAGAVAVRVDAASTPSVDLSGGFDSSALALLAAERLSPDRRVTGVTVHAAGVTDHGDLPYARLVGDHPGIVHRLMPLGVDQVPYSGLGGVPVTDEPAPSTVAYARFAAQLDWMRERIGSDCHLTGDGGDTLLSPGPIMLADLVNAGRPVRAWVETVRWARLRRVSTRPLFAVARRTARVGRRAALVALADTLRTGRPVPAGATSWFPLGAVAEWSTSESRGRAARVAAAVAELADPDPRADFTAYVIAEAMADVGRTARADVELAGAHGTALHNPFVDSRVVDVGLSVPLVDRPGLAEYKPTLAAGMADLFPAELATRTTKGTFTSDYYGGIRANLPALSGLADGHLAICGLVDVPALRRTLRMAAAGVPDAFTTIEPFVRAEVWLGAVLAAGPVHWVPARSVGRTD